MSAIPGFVIAALILFTVRDPERREVATISATDSDSDEEKVGQNP